MRTREWSVRRPMRECDASMCNHVTEARLRSIITVADMVRLAFQQRCLQIAEDSSQSASSMSLSLSVIYDDCCWKYCQKMGSLWARDPCLREQLWFVTSWNRGKSARANKAAWFITGQQKLWAHLIWQEESWLTSIWRKATKTSVYDTLIYQINTNGFWAVFVSIIVSVNSCQAVLAFNLTLLFVILKRQIFFLLRHFLLRIAMKRYSQLSLSCSLLWMHDFGVLVKPKWNSVNIKWAWMASYETGSERNGPGSWQQTLHSQVSKLQHHWNKKGVFSLNTDWAQLTNDRQDKHELLNKMTE